MTNSAPHDGQRPPLSEEKSVRMHETMEHLPPRATVAAQTEGPRQDATGTDRNRTVSAPVSAPPAVIETPEARLRNALQILALKESAADEFVEGFKRSYGKNRQIYNHEIAGKALWAFAWQCLGLDEIERLVQLAAKDLQVADVRRRAERAEIEGRSQLARKLDETWRQMEATNRELADHNADFQAAESVIDSLESQRG